MKAIIALLFAVPALLFSASTVSSVSCGFTLGGPPTIGTNSCSQDDPFGGAPATASVVSSISELGNVLSVTSRVQSAGGLSSPNNGNSADAEARLQITALLQTVGTGSGFMVITFPGEFEAVAGGLGIASVSYSLGSASATCVTQEFACGSTITVPIQLGSLLTFTLKSSVESAVGTTDAEFNMKASFFGADGVAPVAVLDIAPEPSGVSLAGAGLGCLLLLGNKLRRY